MSDVTLLCAQGVTVRVAVLLKLLSFAVSVTDVLIFTFE